MCRALGWSADLASRRLVHDNFQMIDRVSLAVSALGALVCLMLVIGASQAYLAGDEPAWLVALACLLQVTTVWQLVRDIRRRRPRSEAE